MIRRHRDGPYRRLILRRAVVGAKRGVWVVAILLVAIVLSSVLLEFSMNGGAGLEWPDRDGWSIIGMGVLFYTSIGALIGAVITALIAQLAIARRRIKHEPSKRDIYRLDRFTRPRKSKP